MSYIAQIVSEITSSSSLNSLSVNDREKFSLELKDHIVDVIMSASMDSAIVNEAFEQNY